MKPLAFALRCLFAICVLLARPSPGASIFSCRDAAGTLLHQASTDGCVSEICEIKAGGVPVCEASANEQKKRATKEKREDDCRENRNKGMLKEFALLDKFLKRTDIDAKRDTELAANDQDIRAAIKRRDVTAAKLKDLKEEAQFYGPKNPLPEELRANIDFYSKQWKAQDADVSEANAKTERINREYDELLARYDRLLRHEFEPVPCPEN